MISAPTGKGQGGGRIVARGLSKTFGAKVALHPIEVDIESGGITGLLGPNGSGKSTFLRLLTGLVRPDRGQAEVAGARLEGDGLAIRQKVAYSPGELHLYGEMRAETHMAWLLRGRGDDALQRAVGIAKELGLPLNSRVRSFSHGMKRQLQFAATLAPRVPVRILDEPTDGLDPTMRARVLDLLEEDARTGTTLLLSSHHLGEVDRACERLLFLNQGRLVADESAQTVQARSQRSIRVSFADPSDLESIERALNLPGVEGTTREGAQLHCMLSTPDPRPFLAALTQLDLPPPTRIEHGQLSLRDLYRRIYGLEGC